MAVCVCVCVCVVWCQVHPGWDVLAAWMAKCMPFVDSMMLLQVRVLWWHVPCLSISRRRGARGEAVYVWGRMRTII